MDKTLSDFQSELASSAPTPGGGTACAVALGQAAGLTKMVIELTLGKEKWQSGWTHAEHAKTKVDEILNKYICIANHLQRRPPIDRLHTL